nr:glycosyltransferase [Curtobacterium sp. B18]
MPQLTVLIDGTAVPRNLGGVGRYVEGVVSHLTDPTLDVHLVVRPVHAAHFRAVAPHATLHTAPAWTESVPLRFLWEQTGLPTLGRRIGATVLHSPHYTFPFAWRRGSVVTLHDATFFSNPEWHSRLKRTFFTWWSRRSLRTRPVVVVPSAATATEARRVVPGIRADVRVAPLGVDRTVFHEPSTAAVEDARIAATLPDDAAWIAFLGTIEPRKNVTALLDAYASVRDARAVTGSDTPWLVFSGARGWDEAAIERLDALQDADHVVEAGYLPLEDLPGSSAARSSSSTRRSARASVCRSSRRWPRARACSRPDACRCPRSGATPPCTANPTPRRWRPPSPSCSTIRRSSRRTVPLRSGGPRTSPGTPPRPCTPTPTGPSPGASDDPGRGAHRHVQHG